MESRRIRSSKRKLCENETNSGIKSKCRRLNSTHSLDNSELDFNRKCVGVIQSSDAIQAYINNPNTREEVINNGHKFIPVNYENTSIVKQSKCEGKVSKTKSDNVRRRSNRSKQEKSNILSKDADELVNKTKSKTKQCGSNTNSKKSNKVHVLQRPYNARSRKSTEANSDISKNTNKKAKANIEFARNDSGYGSNEAFDEVDESDVIIPNDITLSLKDTQPKSVSRRTSWSRLSGDSPVEQHLFRFGDLNTHKKFGGILKDTPGSHKDSQIRIFHEYQDSDQGDEFGAVLRTYEPNIKGERIRQHFLVNLERNGPADKMRLKNEDELVLVNDVFAPEQTHEEVINLFHHAKVDGKTRFRLVIRRIVIEPVVITKKKQKKSGSKTWQWVETSAILAPDFRQALDDQPIVKNVESEVLSNNQYQTQCYRRYRTENGLYIDISEHGICANKNVSLNGDRTKIIIKTSKYSQDGQGNITWYASLKAIDKTEYICMTKDRATLKTEPEWFVVSDRTSGKIGEDIFFRKNGMYLACNEHSGNIGVSPKVYRFAEKDIKLGFDHPDKGVTMDETSSDFTTCYNPENVGYDPQHHVSDMSMPQHLDSITPYRRNNDMPVTGWPRDINLASTSCSSLECDSPMVTNDYESNGFSSNNSYIPLKTTATMSMMAMCIDN